MKEKILVQHRLLYFKLYLLESLLALLQPFNSNLQCFLPSLSLWNIYDASLLLNKSKGLYLQLQKKMGNEDDFNSKKELHFLSGITSRVNKKCWDLYFFLHLISDSFNENLDTSWNGYHKLSDSFRDILADIEHIFYFQNYISLTILKYGDINKQERDHFQLLLQEIKNSNKVATAIQNLLAILEECKDTVKKQSANDIYCIIALASNTYESKLNGLVKNINYFGKRAYGNERVNGEIIVGFLLRICPPDRIIHLLHILLFNYQNLLQMHACFNKRQQKLVQSICKEKHDYLLRLQLLHTIHLTWLDTLEAIKNKPLSSSIYTELSIVRLIFRKKYYYSAIYKKANADHSLIYQKLFELILQPDSTLTSIIATSETQLDALRLKNVKIESDLKNKINSKYITLMLLLLTENFFFKMGNDLYLALEELTQTDRFKNVPIMNVKMDKHILNFFSSLNGAIFLGAEIYGSAWSGLSYNMIHLITPIFFNDFSLLTRFFKFFKRDEITAIQYMPMTAWLEGLLVYSMLYACFYGASPAILGYFIASYAISTAGRELFTLLFDQLTSSNNSIQSNMFLKTLVQYLGYLAGAQAWHSLFPQLKDFLTVYERDELLSNKELCIADRYRCQQYAAEVLDLAIDANPAEIRKRFRELALIKHPDKVHLDNRSYKYNFFQLTSAKQRFLELNTEPSLQLSIHEIENSNFKIN